MQIIKRILESIGLHTKEEKSRYQLNDNDDDNDFSNEEKLKEVVRDYEQGLKKLARSGQTYQNFDPALIPIFNEYERQKKYVIRFEFIPDKQNFKNVRSALQYLHNSRQPWKEIRDYIELKNKNVCQICGHTSQEFDEQETTNTQCHEVWNYNEHTRIQKLVALQALCVCCHEIKHINRFYNETTYTETLLKRYAFLNKITIAQANKDLDFSYSEKARRKNIEYKLDMRLIEKINSNYAIDKLFNPHLQEFNSFLETKFKKSKSIEPE